MSNVSEETCQWPSSSIVGIDEGRIPYEGEKLNDGIGGRKIFYHSLQEKNLLPAASRGYLKIEKNSEKNTTSNVQFFIQFSWSEVRQFPDYSTLKKAVEDTHLKTLIKDRKRLISDQLSIDPYIFNLHHAVQMVEKYGERLKNIVYFRNKTSQDKDIHTLQINNKTLVLGRLDACQCHNLLKCPTGTSTTVAGSKALEDCKTDKKQILERFSLIPPSWTNHSKICNSTDFSDIAGGGINNTIATLNLKALEIAIFTINLSDTPTVSNLVKKL